MKQIIIISVFVIAFFNNSQSQNLVNNGSFEELTDTSPGFPPQAGDEYAKYWFLPTPTSTDLYNPCLYPIFWLTNEAHTGCAWIAIITYYISIVPGDTISYREYLETKLNTPMIAGKKYNVSFFMKSPYWYEYNSNNIGVLFTQDSCIYRYDQFGNIFYGTIPLTPQWHDTTIVMDSLWRKFQFEYTATGGENFMTIGNFFYNNQTSAIDVYDTTSRYGQSYYFLDDVSVYPSEMTVNVISPNNDGINDYLEFFINDSPIELTVYNRWGNEIYHNKNYSNNYPSNIEHLSDGVYYYVVASKSTQLKGFFHLYNDKD